MLEFAEFVKFAKLFAECPALLKTQHKLRNWSKIQLKTQHKLRKKRIINFKAHANFASGKTIYLKRNSNFAIAKIAKLCAECPVLVYAICFGSL